MFLIKKINALGRIAITSDYLLLSTCAFCQRQIQKIPGEITRDEASEVSGRGTCVLLCLETHNLLQPE